jgi:hypothetical protein
MAKQLLSMTAAAARIGTSDLPLDPGVLRRTAQAHSLVVRDEYGRQCLSEDVVESLAAHWQATGYLVVKRRRPPVHQPVTPTTMTASVNE